MEKTVGAHLHHVEHSISRTYTIKEITKKYIICTTIGKRKLILEECNRPNNHSNIEHSKAQSSGKYRLSVFEDEKEIGRHEADIDVPKNMVLI